MFHVIPFIPIFKLASPKISHNTLTVMHRLFLSLLFIASTLASPPRDPPSGPPSNKVWTSKDKKGDINVIFSETKASWGAFPPGDWFYQLKCDSAGMFSWQHFFLVNCSQFPPQLAQISKEPWKSTPLPRISGAARGKWRLSLSKSRRTMTQL